VGYYQPSLAGLAFGCAVFPPLKRWAIISRPCFPTVETVGYYQPSLLPHR